MENLEMNCRFCGKILTHEFIDLGAAPPANAFLTKEQLNELEVFYPLKIFVCDACFLVQVDEYKKSGDVFNAHYVYFSSYSSSFLEHSRRYVDMITDRLRLGPQSSVMEIASNDGYLLQYFMKKNIPCLGIEPTASTARVAREKGIEVMEEFFGQRLAGRLPKYDLILGNNVLAHVPDINDFVSGLKIALKHSGTITLEFPHVLNLMALNQFDTIYHEHYSYLSLFTVDKIFTAHGLMIYDVEEIAPQGGSLRVYTGHRDGGHPLSDNVGKLLQKERDSALDQITGYSGLQARAEAIKFDLLAFLLKAKTEAKTVIAYGAAAKGNTLFNYCGIRKDLVECVVDASPHKQGKYLPGSHIPVVSEDVIKRNKPDYILILPWNIKEEIVKQLDYVHAWDGQFVVSIPRLEIL